jgi:phosphonate transport system substrate-binding protein
MTRDDSGGNASDERLGGELEAKPVSLRRIVLLILAALAIALTLVKAFDWLQGSEDDLLYVSRHVVSLEETEGAPPDESQVFSLPETPALNVAIAPVVSPEKSIQRYQCFVDYLAEKTGRRPIFLQRQTYGEVNDLVRYRRCDLAFVCTYAFVRGEREFGMEIIAAPQIDGAINYYSFILVRKGSSADSLLDLQGKRFGSADIMSNSGWLYPALWLRDHDKDAKSFFGAHVITGSHDQSVLAVMDGYVDGAAVDSLVYEQMVEEDPSIADRTRIIQKSPPFGMPPMVVPAGIDSDLRAEMQSVLLNMNEDPNGKEILEVLGFDRFVVPDDELYVSVREAALAWESGK